MKSKSVVWLSGGVSSFVAAYLSNPTDIIYIDIDDQHSDTMRYIKDCEKILNKEVQILRSKQYRCVEDCVRTFGGFRNPLNMMSPCTNWLKKRVRQEWELLNKDVDLTYIWGFDVNEKHRAERLVEANLQAKHVFPLIEKGLLKEDAHAISKELGLKRPLMYDLGYNNNNCIGCVKGGMGYWNKIRKDFPDVFIQRAKLERDVGHSIIKGVYLDELKPDAGREQDLILEDCGIMCQLSL